MIETCPYCRETIDAEDVNRCPSCGTPHHDACFAENGGCTVFGCESAPADAPKIAVGSFDIATSAPHSLFASESQSNRTLYFVNRSGEQLGPYSLTELQQHVAGRSVAGSDLAWSEGMPQWVFVCDVLGNLRQPHSYSAVSLTAGPLFNDVFGGPRQAIETGDPPGGQIRFAMEVICWSLGGLIVIGILIAILSSITR